MRSGPFAFLGFSFLRRFSIPWVVMGYSYYYYYYLFNYVFLATKIFFMAIILRLEVAKRRLFEKVSLERWFSQIYAFLVEARHAKSFLYCCQM